MAGSNQKTFPWKLPSLMNSWTSERFQSSESVETVTKVKLESLTPAIHVRDLDQCQGASERFERTWDPKETETEMDVAVSYSRTNPERDSSHSWFLCARVPRKLQSRELHSTLINAWLPKTNLHVHCRGKHYDKSQKQSRALLKRHEDLVDHLHPPESRCSLWND